jgi:hypothetical protein
MKRGFVRMFQVTTNLSSHVLYTVLCAGRFLSDNPTTKQGNFIIFLGWVIFL